MSREELYLDVVTTLTKLYPDWDIFEVGDITDGYVANKIFRLIVGTKDPSLAWKLLRLEMTRYDDFLEDFDDIGLTPEIMNNHIDFIRGVIPTDDMNLQYTY